MDEYDFGPYGYDYTSALAPASDYGVQPAALDPTVDYGMPLAELEAILQRISQPGSNPIQAVIDRGAARAPLDRSRWDQSLVDYYDQMGAYRQKLSDMGIKYEDTSLQSFNNVDLAAAGVSLPNYGQIFADANPQDYYAKLRQTSADPTAAFRPYVDFENQFSTEGPQGFGRLTYDPNKQYRMIGNDGQVVYSGSGLEALQKMSQLVPSLSTKPESTWRIDEAPIGTDNWQSADVKKVNSGTEGYMKVLGTLLPIATSFIPGLNVLSTMALQAASGAIGAGAAGRDPLTGGLIGGLTAGALKVPLPGMQQGISGAVSNALGGGLGNTVGQGVVDKLGDIVVTGARGALSSAAANAALNTGITTAANALANQGANAGGNAGANAPPPDLGPLNTVIGQRPLPFDAPPITFPPLSLSIPDAGPLSQQPTEQPPTDDDLGPMYDAVGQRPLPFDAPPITFPPLSIPDAGPLSQPPAEQPPADDSNEIVVTGSRNPAVPLFPPINFGIDPITQTAINTTADAATAAAAAKEGLSVSDYLRLAALGIGLVGSAAGGSGNRTVPAGFGSGAQFDSPLPPANLPGGIAGGTVRTPIDMGITSPQDWYRYGYGPEQSFFQNVPQGPRNTSTAYTGYARGGFAVQGDGDGRSDSIDARLSDGEYVMDAETVALLGNGSNRAGARKLDRLRVNIRKQKGRKLAKGALSADAKAPERYLAGGLS